MASKKKGPIAGVRVPVKLPWKGATDKTDQFSSIKLPVATFLKFEIAKKDDLLYETKVSKKNKDGSDSKQKATVKRRRKPTYRQRSVTVYFGSAKTGEPEKVSIGGKNVYSISFPITKSVVMSEVVDYFETGKGRSLGVMRVVSDQGEGYPISPG